MKGDASNELDVKVNHFPAEILIANRDGGATEAACGTFYDCVGFGKYLIEILIAKRRKVVLDSGEGMLCRANGL